MDALILRRSVIGCSYHLHIDWSMLELRAMLMSLDDEDIEFVVASVSCLNNAAKLRYSLYEGECLMAM